MTERIPLGDVRPFSPAVLRSGEYLTPKRIPLKGLEESAELVEASKTWLKSGDDPDARRAMLDEMADVLQTIANQCAAFHIGESELRDAQARCETRNRERGRIDATTTPGAMACPFMYDVLRRVKPPRSVECAFPLTEGREFVLWTRFGLIQHAAIVIDGSIAAQIPLKRLYDRVADGRTPWRFYDCGDGTHLMITYGEPSPKHAHASGLVGELSRDDIRRLRDILDGAGVQPERRGQAARL